jgi:hypothetical protein
MPRALPLIMPPRTPSAGAPRQSASCYQSRHRPMRKCRSRRSSAAPVRGRARKSLLGAEPTRSGDRPRPTSATRDTPGAPRTYAYDAVRGRQERGKPARLRRFHSDRRPAGPRRGGRIARSCGQLTRLRTTAAAPRSRAGRDASAASINRSADDRLREPSEGAAAVHAINLRFMASSVQ